jgi:putative membrane protein
MEPEKPHPSYHRRDHLANERTFLAWIRTSIGIMALGFVVEKFALFIQKIAYFLDKEGLQASYNTSLLHHGYSSKFGIVLVGLGALIGLFSYIKFLNFEKQIEEDTYRTSNRLAITLTILVITTGIFLVVYLLKT